jgi:barstar (barnase inhibitor)
VIAKHDGDEVSAKRDAIAAIYAQVAAPEWAASNLDGLADVLRDLSWLPPGPVTIAVPPTDQLADDERRALQHVLHEAVIASAASDRPVLLTDRDDDS